MTKFSPLAVSIASSPKFKTSGGDAERDPLLSLLQDQLFQFVEKAAFHLYANDSAYYEAQTDLQDFVKVLVIDHILDVLMMLGVTGDGVKAELCRVVILGGVLFDGMGFMEGQPVEGKEAERKAA